MSFWKKNYVINYSKIILLYTICQAKGAPRELLSLIWETQRYLFLSIPGSQNNYNDRVLNKPT